MLTYNDFTQFFGKPINDEKFQEFLKTWFSDLDISEYSDFEFSYISSKAQNLSMGFEPDENIKYENEDENDLEEDDEDEKPLGTGQFAVINIYPSTTLINPLPFTVTFTDNRAAVIKKAGNPTQTKGGNGEIFLVDNYKVSEDVIVTFDYNAKKETLNFIQIRDNNLFASISL
jgi:hypothetical protein